MTRRTGTLEEEVVRYWSRCVGSSCMHLPGSEDARYGTITHDGGKQTSAHRAAYIVAKGPIPEGLVVRHSCDRMSCCNPDHLSVGTHADNERDKYERNRARVGASHYMARHDAAFVSKVVKTYLEGGRSQAEVARLFDLAQSTVGRWVRAESRKDAGLAGFVQGKGSRALAQPLAPCGTRAAYGRHLSRNEPVCEPCREANRAYMSAYKAKRWIGSAA